MESKICSKCLNEYPVSTEYWNLQKNGKYGLRSICKPCSRLQSKEYRQKPGFKEKNRKRQALWRKNNKEKAREIDKRCRDKNRERINETRRQTYKTDEEYRNKRKEYDIKYRKSGRRKELYHTTDVGEKARKRTKLWHENNKEYSNEYNRKYKKDNPEIFKKLYKKHSDELIDSKIVHLIKRSSGLEKKDIPKELIETRRLIIKLKRELKTNYHGS